MMAATYDPRELTECVRGERPAQRRRGPQMVHAAVELAHRMAAHKLATLGGN